MRWLAWISVALPLLYACTGFIHEPDGDLDAGVLYSDAGGGGAGGGVPQQDAALEVDAAPAPDPDQGVADMGLEPDAALDAELPDGEPPDGEPPDGDVDGEVDGGADGDTDVEVPDAEVPDAEVPDAEVPDAEPADGAPDMLPDATIGA